MLLTREGSVEVAAYVLALKLIAPDKCDERSACVHVIGDARQSIYFARQPRDQRAQRQRGSVSCVFVSERA
jgi:hypothetical protein